jgi:hypothetical protein
MLPPGLAPERLMPIYGQTPYLSTISSTSGDAYSGLDPYAGPYICTTISMRETPNGASILQPSTGATSSCSSAASPDQDLADDYPETRGSTCWDTTEEGHLIITVAPAGAPSHNSSSRYRTIRRSEASDSQTPNDGMIQNLNPNFNVVHLQTIMESIQIMAHEGSPIVALAQQGAEVTNYVIAQ